MTSLVLLLAFQQSFSGLPFGFILQLLLIVGIFYFLVFMPMQRQRRTQQQMLRDLQNGNTVLTTGGIVGTIISVNSDDTLILRVKPDNVKLQVARSAVSGLVTEEKKSA
jgi:preprotein translocase subunit YajC